MSSTKLCNIASFARRLQQLVRKELRAVITDARGGDLDVGEANRAVCAGSAKLSKVPSSKDSSIGTIRAVHATGKLTKGSTTARRTLMRSTGTVLMVSVFTLLAAGTAFAAGQPPPVRVPMPASLGLLVTGLVGLAGASWWLRRK